MLRALAALLLAAAPPVDAHGDPLPADAVARLGTVRFRPGSQLKGLAFTPDGKRIVSHGPLCGVQVWDAATGRLLAAGPNSAKVWVDHAWPTSDGKAVLTVEWPKSSRLAVSRTRGTAVCRRRRLTDFGVEREVSIGAMAVLGPSPDGRLLAGQVETDTTHVVEIWNIQEGKRVRAWAAHDASIHGHAFAADGTTLVTGGEDKVIRFWDVATGAKKIELVGHPGMVGALALSAAGDTLVSVALIRTERPAGGYSEEFDGRIRVWDVPGRRQVRQIETPVGGTDLRFAPDGKTLVHLGCDRELHFWDVATGKEVRLLKQDGQRYFAVAPDGKTVAVGGHDIRLLTVADGTVAVKADGHRAGVVAAGLLADGRTVVTAADTVARWDARTGRLQRRLIHEDTLVWRLHVLAGGRLLGCDPEKTLFVWDAATGRELLRVPMTDVTYLPFAPSPDGKTVVVQRRDRTLSRIDLGTGKELARLEPGPGRVTEGIAFAADGRSLVTWHRDHSWSVWDLKPGKIVREYAFASPRAVGYVAAVSPDGRRVVYGNSQRHVALHDVETGKALWAVGDLAESPALLAVSPDNRTLAWTPWNEDAVHLVELASGKERTRFAGHRGLISAVEFAADGRTLLTASHDTTALIWDVLGGGDAVALGPKELDAAWADLTDADAATAFRAMRRLAACPDAVGYLRKRLVPIPVVAEERLAKLIAELDSDTFADRERASRELEKLGDVAAEACRTALAGKPPPEQRRRLERLLAPLDAEAARPTGDRLRLIRGVEVLERFATPEAAALLRALAGGAPGAFLTRQAAEADSRKGR